MDWIVVEDLRPWDGRYPFDLEAQPFTRREWGWIKRLAGYLPADVDDGWRGGDPQLYAVFAIVAMHRAGRLAPGDVDDVHERLLDGGVLRLETDSAADPAEGDADPSGSANGSSSISGHDTTTSSEISAGPPRPTGTPASDTSASPLAESLI